MSSQFGSGEDTPGVERGDGAAAQVDGAVEQFASARKVGSFEQCGGLAEEECGLIAIGGIRGPQVGLVRAPGVAVVLAQLSGQGPDLRVDVVFRDGALD